VYTVREMLRDIQGCLSRRVILVVDQSYSGEVLKAVHNANNLSNVLVFASGTGHQPAWQGDFTAHWSRAAHRNTCLQQVYDVSFAFFPYFVLFIFLQMILHHKQFKWEKFATVFKTKNKMKLRF